MEDTSKPPSERKPSWVSSSSRWLSRRHRTAVSLMLRGACTGTGTAAVGIVAVWVQHRI